MNTQPIELNRRFNLVENNDGSGKNAEDAQREAIENFFSGHYSLPEVSWAGLLEMPRVVILAEAGTGKTEELRLRAKTLQNEGKSAFFCRMESVAEEKDFRKALLSEEEKHFDKWLKGEDVGYFFVDSVDEAKLHPFSVDSALRPLSRALNEVQGRARVYISSRASEWDAGRDFSEFHKCFPGESPRIAFLLPLNPEQQELFVEKLGLQGGKVMLETARRTGDYLVNRPLDLQATAEYWKKHGRIDSPMKMMKNSVSKNLREWNPERAKQRPLNPDKAQRGAENLAAALTLCGQSRIRIPSRALARPSGIDASEVLPNWGEDEISALLDRRVFDPEIYGTVRFHHREVREYLAARWFKRILGGGTLSGSTLSILPAFETAKYGESFVYPAMRPIAAWLAQMENGEGDFSRRMLKLEPVTMMTRGDPSVLSPKFRENVLRAATKKIADNREAESIYNISLERFEGADTANVVNELLDTFSGNPEIVEFLLRIIDKGKIYKCADQALDIALNESMMENLRYSAIYAVTDVSAAHATKLARKVVDQADKWTGRDLARAMSRLFPKSMNIGQFVQCIEKKAGAWEGLADESYLLENISLEGMTDEELRKFLNGILAAAKARAKRAGGWAESLTATLAAKALMPVLNSSDAPHEDEHILHAIEFLEKYQEQGMSFSEQQEIAKKISANWQLAYALYWRMFQREGPKAWAVFNMFNLSGNPELFRAFLSDIQAQSDVEKRTEAFDVVWQLWYGYGSEKPSELAEIRAALAENGAMLHKLDEHLKQVAESRRKQEQREKDRKERQRQDKETKEKGLRQSIEHLQKISAQLCDFDAEPSPNVVRALLYLYEWMHRNDRPTIADESDNDNDSCRWKNMIPVFGEKVACCARDGMMKFWRTYNPQPISEVRAGSNSWRTDTRVYLGMLGLDILHRRQPGWAAQLTKDEAVRAARYATHCSNRFPKWFTELISERQEAAGEVMRSEMEKDIRQFADNTSPNILPAMLHSDEFLGKFFAQMALDILEKNPAVGRSARSNVSRLLRFLKDDNAIERKVNFYRGRIAQQDAIDEQSFWLAEWMRVDANAALEELERHLREREIDNPDHAKKFMVNFCGSFGDETRTRNTQGLREAGLWGNISRLRKMLHLTFQYVRYEDDINRAGGGVFSPEIRDDAQDFRDTLFNHLVARCSGEEAHRAMIELSADTALDDYTRGIFRMRARRCAETDAKIPAWEPDEIVVFANDMTPPLRDPSNFFQWFLSILNKIKSDWEGGDFSPKDQIHIEEDAQILAARDLENISGGKFTVIRENEVINRKKPDLRIQPCGGGSVVPVEMKIADKWYFHQLQDALETQLPQYLHAPQARHGILLLIYKGRKKQGWETPFNSSANFAELTDMLGNQAKELAGKIGGVDDIRVIGIDLSKAEKPNSPPRDPRKKASKAPSAKHRKRKT